VDKYQLVQALIDSLMLINLISVQLKGAHISRAQKNDGFLPSLILFS